MSKYAIFIVFVTLLDVVVIWLYFRSTADRNVTTDQPELMQAHTNSTLGVFPNAAVVSTALPCPKFGKMMLEKGGNAVDAAVATLLCDGVCMLHAMGVGGGCFMTIYNKTEQKVYSLVARETAPALANQTMFVANPTLSTFGPLAAGIPGELKGYQAVHSRFGKLDWKTVFQPTIDLCETGVPVSQKLAYYFQQEEDILRASPSAMAVLLNSTGGRLPKEGELLKLPRLANTLRVIADSPNMAEELYNGSLTKQFVADIQAAGGIISEHDMNNYQVRWEEPINASLAGGFTMYSVPLPGSGVLVAFMLRLLDGFLQLANSDLERSQLMIETFKHAFGHRNCLGDPYFVDKAHLQRVLFKLTDEGTIKGLRSKIHFNSTSQDVSYYGAAYLEDEHGTDNIAVLDQDGNAVCVTSSINAQFGSKFVSTSTGIILNNHMSDFSTPGVQSYWWVAPSTTNLIEPGKRPLSSMSPTIVVDSQGEVQLVMGAATGGTSIVTQTTAVAVANLWLNKNIKEAIDEPRFHHQLIPMEVFYEYDVPKEMVKGWKNIGHKTKLWTADDHFMGAVTGIARLDGKVTANCDWRCPGGVAGL